ncbi:putative iron reductase domain protein [Xylariaceae sp. FL0255]|nr:putative iron reductase domain protein [Xylariaceae sp. FL0255]
MKWSWYGAALLGACGLASAQTTALGNGADSTTASAQSSPYTDGETGITFQRYTTPNNISYAVALPLTANGSAAFDVVFQITAPASLGWVGWSWGGNMTYSPLTVAWPNGNSVTLSSRWTIKYALPVIYNDANYTILEKGTEANADYFKLTGVCTGCSVWLNDQGYDVFLNGAGNVNMAFAWSSEAVDQPANISSTFTKHDGVGHWVHDLANARTGSYGTYISNNLPTPAPVAPSTAS